MLNLPADTGDPMPETLAAKAAVQRHAFPSKTRQVALRNTGDNTLWFSFNKKKWIDVAAGTSWDERTSVDALWYCTQLGTTIVSVVGVALLDTGNS